MIRPIFRVAKLLGARTEIPMSEQPGSHLKWTGRRFADRELTFGRASSHFGANVRRPTFQWPVRIWPGRIRRTTSRILTRFRLSLYLILLRELSRGARFFGEIVTMCEFCGSHGRVSYCRGADCGEAPRRAVLRICGADYIERERTTSMGSGA